MNKEIKRNKPSSKEIATLAYQLWQKGGCKPGRDVDNWLEAEKQLNHRADVAASQKELTQIRENSAVAPNAPGRPNGSEARSTNARVQKPLACAQ